jgi:hypothetical protein
MTDSDEPVDVRAPRPPRARTSHHARSGAGSGAARAVVIGIERRNNRARSGSPKESSTVRRFSRAVTSWDSGPRVMYHA